MTRTGIFIAALSSLVAATVVTGSIMRAEATDGAQPNTSCATTAACIEGDNTSTGPGVRGTSTKGHGVVGTTKSKGTTSGTDHAGVLGQDLQTAGGPGNAGVEGTSTNGTGVLGTTTSGVAVNGTSTNNTGVNGSGKVGVVGTGTTAGVAGISASEGVEGTNSTTGDAILANGFGGPLFRGNNSSAQDVFIVDNSGNTEIGGNFFSVGAATAASGTFGTQTLGGYGVAGESDAEGVEGVNNTTGDAIYANGFGGLLFRGNNSVGSDVFDVDDSGDVFAVSYNYLAEATKLQRTSQGQTVKTYSSQAARPTLEDDGEAQLVDGIARVAFDSTFGAAIDRYSYMVQVTPEGMTHGVLCVVQRTPSGFVVQENMNGHSTVPFSYRIVAKPYGSVEPRLPLATVPGHFGQIRSKQRPVLHLFKMQYHPKAALAAGR